MCVLVSLLVGQDTHFDFASLLPDNLMRVLADRLPHFEYPIVLTVHHLQASQAAQLFGGRYELAYRLSENRLSEVPYFAGSEFTVADIMMVFSLTTMRAVIGRSLDPSPNLRAYLKRIGERPAYQRAMKKGDPEMKLTLE